MSTSDHDELGKLSGGRTMQLDALPEELVEGITGEDSGYQLADERPGPSAPPPLPPKTSAPPAAAEGSSKKTVVLAVVVAVLMAVAGVVVGTLILDEGEAPAEPPPSLELGDIEVDSH